ncbi:cation:proton antiporter [Microbacterium sp. AK031]|uniref:cation:proton antiporter n=1 Tax=Microbacterium sp. AK031 TaxID=2723076 RepID=UPI00216A1DD7|nr:cation:proton antiporter [Microbacterium sp. AK031]MCS3842949.1 Kef-type K+ transport system membrane component KefB [Microbacterium sp. AK031]
MTASDFGLVLIPLLAVAAPLLARGIRPVLRVPIIVFELVLGILFGPAVLGWAEPSQVLDKLSDFGLAMLFFMAGNEIDFPAVTGRPLVRASLGWLLSLALGIAVGFLIAPDEGMVVIGIALSSTALGTLMPILRDARELDTPFGKVITTIGAVGEFLPLIAVSIFLSTRKTPVAAAILLTFVILAGAVILVARRAPHGRLHAVVRATLHTSEQFGVRFVLLLIAGLVGLSVVLDLDMLLGAFVAGAVWRIIMARAPKPDAEAIESKIEAIAFGLLVPIFFLYTGVTFDLDLLIASPVAVAMVPLFLIALLVIRGAAAQLSAPSGASVRERTAIGMLAATGLPIIVAVTAIGVDEKILDPAMAAALVGAGMLSVLAFPLIAMTLRGDRARLDAVERDLPLGEL